MDADVNRIGFHSAFGDRRSSAFSSQAGPLQRALGWEARDLEKLLGSHLPEFLSVAREPNREMLAEGMLQLGIRLESDERTEAASRIYAWTETQGIPGSSARARDRLDVLRGQGPGSAHAEFLLRRVVKETASPTALFAMGAAGAVSRMTRWAVFSRLAAAPGANILTRGPGLRLAGEASGLFAESLTFTAGLKGGAALLGHHQDWSPLAFGREWAASALLLGGLHLTGGLSQSAVRRWASGANAWERLTRAVAPQLGMFSGILLGNRLQEIAGYRRPSGMARELGDALATLIQFQVGGRLARAAMGEGFHLLDRRWQAQIEGFARPRFLPQTRPVKTPDSNAAALPEIPSFLMLSEGRGLPGIRQLIEEALAWGRSRLSRPEAPSSGALRLARNGRYPYELVLPDADWLLTPGREHVIATREGREISLLTTVVRPANEPLDVPEDSRRVAVVFTEGRTRGTATLYVAKDDFLLYDIDAAWMAPGIGTIVLDWLATQAALQRKTFGILSIHNPQIIRILNRKQLLDPRTAWISGITRPALAPLPVPYEGPLDDPFFQETHEGANFRVQGWPHPELLPPALRSSPPPLSPEQSLRRRQSQDRTNRLD